MPKLGGGNTADAISGLTLMFIVPPVLLALAASAIVRGWPIDATTQARNAEALSA